MADDAVARLRKLDVCDLSDALDALKLEPAVTGLRPLGTPRPIAGRAVTVRLVAGPPPTASTRHLGTAAVEAAGPDDLIVIEQRSGIDAAAWGGILSRAAQHRGIAGTVIEGPGRDVEEADSIGYPVYARSSTARTARGRIYEAEFQVAITVGGTTVSPGDYVAADRSGCVVIPAAHIADVLARAEDIRDKSERMAAAVAKGLPVSQVMGGDYENMLHGKSEDTPSHG
jgi:regulator of RNase E activity RraA